MRVFILITFLPLLGFTQLQFNDIIYNENKYDIIVFEENQIAQINYTPSILHDSIDSAKTIINLFPVDVNCQPIGLLINDGKKFNSINNKSGNGNFFLKPNAVFIREKSGKVKIVESVDFKFKSNIDFAFQSGPALILKSKIHPKFNYFSSNLSYRSGIGIREINGVKQIILAVSKQPVNLFDFSEMFLNRFQCNNAVSLQSGNTFLIHNKKPWSSNSLLGNCGALCVKGN